MVSEMDFIIYIQVFLSKKITILTEFFECPFPGTGKTTLFSLFFFFFRNNTSNWKSSIKSFFLKELLNVFSSIFIKNKLLFTR